MSIQELHSFLESFWDRGKCGCFGRGHGRQGVVETQGCIEIISHSLQIGKSEVDSWHQSHGPWVSMDLVIRVAKRCSCREAGSFCNHEIADLILHHMGTLLCKIFFFQISCCDSQPGFQVSSQLGFRHIMKWKSSLKPRKPWTSTTWWFSEHLVYRERLWCIYVCMARTKSWSMD